MYNRYIPQPDGSYRREWMQDQPQPRPSAAAAHHQQSPPPPPVPPPREPPKQQQHCRQTGAADFLHQLLPSNLDTGDLLILLLLLLMAGDCREDRSTALLTLVLYLLM